MAGRAPSGRREVPAVQRGGPATGAAGERRRTLATPRLEIDLDKVYHNARSLVDALAERGISVTGVTKATLGSAGIAAAWLRAGVTSLGDSRIENIESLRSAHVHAPFTLIRSPMPSQVDRVVRQSDVSVNTEIEVIRRLSAAASDAGRTHGVVLMVELGDLREGIMPVDLEDIARETLRLPNLALEGIGTNLACRSGVSPDSANMTELSTLAGSIEETFSLRLRIVSGGSSANLDWALSGADTGRINNLRLGESLLLGREPLRRRPIDGLHTDAFTLIAEVIESKRKPSQPWGDIAQTAFGEPRIVTDNGDIRQAIVAIGEQDTDPVGLVSPAGIEIIGASSDHLVMDCGREWLLPGDEVRFQLNYSALVRAMTSPFVAKVMQSAAPRPGAESRPIA